MESTHFFLSAPRKVGGCVVSLLADMQLTVFLHQHQLRNNHSSPHPAKAGAKLAFALSVLCSARERETESFPLDRSNRESR